MEKFSKWLMSKFVSRKIKLSKINEAYDTSMKCIDMDREFLQNYECEGKNEDVTKLVKDWFDTKHVLYRQLLKCDRMLEESYEKINQLCFDDLLERMQSDNVQILLKKHMSHILEYRNNINSFIISRDKYDDEFISNVCSLQDQDRDKGNFFGGNYSYKFDGYSINSGMGNNKGRGRVRRR